MNIDLKWLNSQSVKQSTKYLRLIELKNPLEIYIDGSTGKGNIMKPISKTQDMMDEEESSGI